VRLSTRPAFRSQYTSSGVGKKLYLRTKNVRFSLNFYIFYKFTYLLSSKFTLFSFSRRFDWSFFITAVFYIRASEILLLVLPPFSTTDVCGFDICFI